MTSEQARVGLYNRLDDVLGKPHSDTLMSGLVVDAGPLATKADISRLEERFERLEERFSRLEDRIDRMDERFVGVYKTIIAAQVGLAAIITLALRLFG